MHKTIRVTVPKNYDVYDFVVYATLAIYATNKVKAVNFLRLVLPELSLAEAKHLCDAMLEMERDNELFKLHPEIMPPKSITSDKHDN